MADVRKLIEYIYVHTCYFPSISQICLFYSQSLQNNALTKTKQHVLFAIVFVQSKAEECTSCFYYE